MTTAINNSSSIPVAASLGRAFTSSTMISEATSSSEARPARPAARDSVQISPQALALLGIEQAGVAKPST